MQYDKGFKLQALQLSDEIEAKAVAEQQGVKYHTLYDWRKVRKAMGESVFVSGGHQNVPISEKDKRIRELEVQLRESNCANEILKEALGFFATSRNK